jgi:hypothetical protein
MNDEEKVKLLDSFERATLELTWAKFNRSKTKQKKFDQLRAKVLEQLLGRKPTEAEINGSL